MSEHTRVAADKNAVEDESPVLHEDQPPRQDAHGVQKKSSSVSRKGDDFRWYVIHAYSGFEKKVKQAIKDRALQKGFASSFQEILVPTEEVIEHRGGRRFHSERKFLPGYILARMKMNDETWRLVRETPKVTRLLGTGRPMPITDLEAERILRQVHESAEQPRLAVTFDPGEHVRVCEGPFASFNGVVEDVDPERSRLKVSVSIFGRSTPVELEYRQVEKL